MKTDHVEAGCEKLGGWAWIRIETNCGNWY